MFDAKKRLAAERLGIKQNIIAVDEKEGIQKVLTRRREREAPTCAVFAIMSRQNKRLLLLRRRQPGEMFSTNHLHTSKLHWLDFKVNFVYFQLKILINLTLRLDIYTFLFCNMRKILSIHL